VWGETGDSLLLRNHERKMIGSNSFVRINSLSR
jgi:hypothetical protein